MLLELRSVTRAFGGLKAVNQVSLELFQGETLGLIGPNGAGKTTTFNLISGFLRPERGAIHFDGQRVDGRPAHALATDGLVCNALKMMRSPASAASTSTAASHTNGG